MVSLRRLALVSVLVITPVVSAYTYRINLSPLDIATGQDVPMDGTFDSFTNPGSPSLVDNGFTELSIAAEFDLSSIELPVASATLNFVAESSNIPAVIEIHGYPGGGGVSLADVGFRENLLGSVPGSSGTNSLDVTEFVKTSREAEHQLLGFSFDEALRTETPPTNSFRNFQLIVETEDDGLTSSIIPLIPLLEQRKEN